MFRKTTYLLILVVVSFCLTKEVNAQTTSYHELQAAYIFNFAKYIKWPGEAQTFVIGVYDSEEALKLLETTLSGKKIGGKTIELKVISKTDNFDGYHIIYIPEDGSKDAPLVSDLASGKNILIVTEQDLIRKGAVISFVVEDEKLRFKLKKSALTNAGLVASEGLLRLAIIL